MNSLWLPLLVTELEEAPLYEINAFARDIFCTLCIQKLCAVETKNSFLLNSNEIVVSREELQLSNDTSMFLFNLLGVLDALPVNLEVTDVSLVALSVHSIFPSQQNWFYISKTCTIKIVYIL